MPYFDQSGPMNIPDGKIEFFFQQCAEKGIKFILFFCEDGRHKKKVRDCANLYRGKGKLFAQSYAYITPEDVKVEADLLAIIENILDGYIEIESSEDEEKNNEKIDEDIIYDGEKKNVFEYLFNPPGSTDFRTFSSTARPITSHHFIEGDGNCGFRSMAHLLTGESWMVFFD